MMHLCPSVTETATSALPFSSSGLGTTALGIAETRRGFTSRPGLLATVKAWVLATIRRAGTSTATAMRRLLRRPRPLNIHVRPASDAARASDVGSVTVYYGDPPHMSIEEQVAALDARTRALRDDVAAVRTQIEEGRSQARKSLAEEAQARQERDDWLADRLEDLAAGGLRLETWGRGHVRVGNLPRHGAGRDRRVAALLVPHPPDRSDASAKSHRDRRSTGLAFGAVSVCVAIAGNDHGGYAGVGPSRYGMSCEVARVRITSGICFRHGLELRRSS